MVNNVEYQKRNSRVAFVFSCLGRKEEDARAVCSGQTGDNLNDMLCYCHHKLSDVFHSEKKDDYTITNDGSLWDLEKKAGNFIMELGYRNLRIPKK